LLVLKLAGQSINVNAQSMFISILQITLIPILLGFLINKYFNKYNWFKDVKMIMPGSSVIGLALIVGGVIAAVGDQFFTSGLIIFLAILIHNSTGYVIGYLIGIIFGMSKEKKRTISIEIGMQNAGLATNLASAHFAAYPLAAVACAVSCVWHSISGTLLAGIYLQRDKYDERKYKLENNNSDEIIKARV
jgi:BASS family bile acid:Na+ symporter